MKLMSLLLSLALPLFAPADAQAAQPLPGDSVYQLEARVTDQQGRERAWGELAGRPRVVSMFYTHCHLMCPLIIENAKGVRKQLGAAEAARLDMAMISLDPVRDTPAAMRERMEAHGVAEGWTFLTPRAADVRALAGVMDIRYRPLDDGSINHTSVLVLLDAQGRVLARTEVENAIPDPIFIRQVRQALATPASSP
ncbi:SCO family protein [Pseudoxanthomonas mexicana]|uniref:SCO family protein n=1 Tax=Pseudoxanthomonas mexicana TaxID=128785 RepID=UPI00398B5742